MIHFKTGLLKQNSLLLLFVRGRLSTECTLFLIAFLKSVSSSYAQYDNFEN